LYFVTTTSSAIVGSGSESDPESPILSVNLKSYKQGIQEKQFISALNKAKNIVTQQSCNAT